MTGIRGLPEIIIQAADQRKKGSHKAPPSGSVHPGRAGCIILT